jgi:SurA N-terminal domain
VVVLGIGWYQSYVAPYHQTVITVGSMRANMNFFIKQLKELLPRFQGDDPNAIAGHASDAATSSIEQQFILLQRAPAMGISVSDQDVDDTVAQQLGVIGANGQPPDRVALESGLRDKLGSTGLSLDELRQQVKASMLQDKVQTKLQADYPKTGPAAKYDLMTIGKTEDANTILNRLNAGESWDTIANEIRQNVNLGTVTSNDFQPKLAIDDALVGPLFDLSNGQYTKALPTADGRYAIARLVEKDDQHQYSDDMLNTIGPKLYSNWIDDQKKSIPVKVNLSDDAKLFALKNSGWTPNAQQAPQQPPAQQQPGANPQAPVSVPAQAPGLQNLPPGIATPQGGLNPPNIPAPAGSPAP